MRLQVSSDKHWPGGFVAWWRRRQSSFHFHLIMTSRQLLDRAQHKLLLPLTKFTSCQPTTCSFLTCRSLAGQRFKASLLARQIHAPQISSLERTNARKALLFFFIFFAFASFSYMRRRRRVLSLIIIMSQFLCAPRAQVSHTRRALVVCGCVCVCESTEWKILQNLLLLLLLLIFFSNAKCTHNFYS